MEKTYSKIRSIKPAGRSKVFDFTVKDTHRILANNFYTSNCHISHPDILSFITKKDDLTKVTGANVSVKVTNEFMEAVEHDRDYYLSWPIQEKQPEIRENLPYNSLHILEDGTHVRRIRAKELWNTIVHQAHKNAEPGVLFWDNVINESPADSYAKFGFVTKGTNPCITGETLVSVADGRGEVRIDQLEKEGRDVPVYTLNDKGDIEIQMMRNPRITGYNEKIYKVTFDSGDSVRVTGNHKIRLKDGSYREAKDLEYGDSVHIMSRSELALDDIYESSNSKSADYIWIQNGGKKKYNSEHRMIYEFESNSNIEPGYVIHHKDFNSKNNHPSNLQKMEKYEHIRYHADLIKGDKNPYHKMTDEWKLNFARHEGSSNGMYSGISNFYLYKAILNKTKELNRRISKKEWKEYAKEMNLPENLHSGFRGGSHTYLLERAASYLGLEHVDKDPRLVRTYFKACSNGYETKIEDNKVMVKKHCEECGSEFWQEYGRREISFCSHTCSNLYLNRNTDVNVRRTDTINKTYSKKAEANKENQLRIYSQLKFDLGRDPLIAEWREKCGEGKVPSRLGTKNGFSKWTEVKELAENYNHKVVSVELDGYENVYNGTVDKWHNFFIGGFKSLNQMNKPKYLSINNLQCGEVPLSPYDSCRLGSLNVFMFVDDPFTAESEFRWDKLGKKARIAQRFMDDIVELEEEKIQKIIDKIESDPEDIEVKRTELNTWKRVLEVLRNGRRTGVGILGLGDAMAALGIKFGTPEATKFAEDVQKCIAINSYKETVNLAKERGSFPIWNADLEASNPFIRRIIADNFGKDEYKDYLDYGRRNIATMSIAPTGSLAIEAQTTSGIEPVFKIFYRRRKKVNPGDENVNITFVDQNGDSWEEYNVIHKPFVNWYYNKFVNEGTPLEEAETYLKNLEEKALEELVSESPWGGAESHDIDYIEKINMQGAIQKWVDHSISVTHNLPEKISEEEVNNIYFHGWKAGCKGLTIYREGSRTGVLLSNKEKETTNTEFKESKAPKRPKELPADYYVAKAQGREFAIIIGRWVEEDGTETNRPYEIFAFENPPGKKNTKGKIIKVKQGHYKFVNGEFEIEELQLAADSVEHRMLTLTASMLLRHGAPIRHVNNVIKKIDDGITTFSSVVRRYLSRYIEEEVIDGEKCPTCGGNNISLEEGCRHCLDCGWSACG
jgi:ribonucleotide reductase alpha subunit